MRFLSLILASILVLLGARAELTGDAEIANRLVRDFYKAAKDESLEKAKIFLSDTFVYRFYGRDSSAESFINVIKEHGKPNLDEPKVLKNEHGEIILNYKNKNNRQSYELDMTINVNENRSFKLGLVVVRFVTNS